MITIENLTLWGTEKSLIVDSFSDTIRIGEKVVITGPSGCGKSSILRAIAAGSELWQGTIFFDSVPLTSKTVHEIRQKIAFVHQEPLLPDGTVGQLFDMVRKWKGNRGTVISRKKKFELFEQLLLESTIIEKETAVLSGGERQRIAIIIAVLLNRPILLADEITSALDEQSRNAVMDLIFSLPVTMISVSHDHVWIKGCSRTILMKGTTNE